MNILSGIKVLDAASFLAGPCAATIMGDYGAEVTKVEPLTGDRHRTISAGHPVDHSWQLTGRNKRSLALNIASEEGRSVLLEFCLLYTSPSPRDRTRSRMPSSA